MTLTSLRRAVPRFFIFVWMVALTFLIEPSFAIQQKVIKGLASLACGTAEQCYHSAIELGARRAERDNDEDRLNAKIDGLRGVEESAPESIWARRARLLRGVLLRERDPSEALKLLTQAQREWPLLGDYIRFWRAEALTNLGETVEAAGVFESIPREVPGTLLKTQAQLRGGNAWYDVGRCAKAINLLRKAVARDPQDAAAPAGLLKVADCQLREVRTAEGLATLQQVWAQFPQSPEAFEAWARLNTRSGQGVWQPTPEALLERAESSLGLALYKEAVESLQEFLAIGPGHPRRDEAQFNLGLAHARLKQYDQARRIFQESLEKPGSEAGSAAVWLARIYVRQGEGERLRALSQQSSSLPLSAEQRASIFLYLGVWLEDEGHGDQAIAAYNRAMRRAGGSTVGLKAVWRIGWLQYRSDRLGKAVNTFQQGLKKSGQANGWPPRFLYWMARALEQQQGQQAAQAYARLCRDYPLTYYGQLVSSCTQAFAPDLSEDVDAQDSAPGPNGHPVELAKNLHYQKAIELKQLRMDEDAARELVWVSRRGVRTRRALLELSAELAAVGAHHEALRVAKIYFPDNLDGGRRPTAPTLWHVAYPTSYLPTIRTHADNHVDPYLVAAIIREESLYDSQALSPAGAVGLMQIMPATARRLTESSGDLREIRDQLFDQQTNIRLGSHYLGKLLNRFSGNIIHAVAAYNAGPTAVSSWIKRNGHTEPAAFVELIPYRETRGYVKRVLRSYREYHRIGNGGCEAHSLDKAC